MKLRLLAVAAAARRTGTRPTTRPGVYSEVNNTQIRNWITSIAGV